MHAFGNEFYRQRTEYRYMENWNDWKMQLQNLSSLPIPDFIGRILNLGRLSAKAGLVTRNAYTSSEHWKRISETNLKSRWKWTEMVKLKEDKQVGQNFIELKHMAVVILLNYLKTEEMLNNCKAKWLGCVLTLPIYRGREQHGKGREAGDKGTGSGRAGYGSWEILTPCPPPHHTHTHTHTHTLLWIIVNFPPLSKQTENQASKLENNLHTSARKVRQEKQSRCDGRKL